MKKTFTLLSTLFLSIILFAGPTQSRLSISATGNAEVRVIVDGNRYRSNNGVVMISKLNSGNHSVKIYQARTDRNNNPRNGNGRNNYQQVYSNTVFIKPQYHVDIVINRFGKAFIDEQPVSMGYYDDEDDDWGNDNNNNNNNGGYNNNTAMSAVSFEQFRQAVKKENFDDSRMNIAKQGISTNYFTATQVREIVNLFTFDAGKLEIAKYAYQYTLDKGNYFMVVDAMDYSKSKEDLARYIQNYK